MANKRDLKKFIRNTCSSLAIEMNMAARIFPQIDADEVEKIIVETALLLHRTLRRVDITFDHVRRDYDNKADYYKARKEYFRHAYGSLLSQFDAEVQQLVSHMNRALPQDVRMVLKEAASK